MPWSAYVQASVHRKKLSNRTEHACKGVQLLTLAPPTEAGSLKDQKLSAHEGSRSGEQAR